MLAETDRAREALYACNPDCPREDWVKLAMAAKAAGVDADTFHAWSSQAPSYNERDAKAVWKSVNAEGGITAKYLFKAGVQNGWHPSRTERPTRPRVNHAPARPSKGPAAQGSAQDAAEVWARCRPASADHPYIVAKQGHADGLRVVPEGDRLTIAGLCVAGWLAVPVVPLGGHQDSPVSLQFIPPPGTGKKLNLPGASVAGVFIVGEAAAGGTVYLCEGIGQAWACWKATGCAAVVCFGWGRVGMVAAELRARDTSARVVIVPDVGKEQEGEAIAREVQGRFVTMPEGWEENADVNDYAMRDGFDALEVLLSKPREPKQRYRLLGADDLRALPPLAWRIRGVLPAEGLASIFGPSTSGKSFLALDLAAAIAEGRDWFGYRVKPAPVVYVALEGEAGFRGRIQAWELFQRRTLPEKLRVVMQPFKLTTAQDVLDLAEAVHALGTGAVVIIDTLNRAAPEADENKSSDMGQILESAKELQRVTRGLVVLVHHTGKDATKGMRGHSSLFAALDAALEVAREGGRREWKVEKAKNGQDGATHPFRLVVLNLGDDQDGEPETSCVVEADQGAAEVRRVKLPQGGNQRIVLDALGPLFKASAQFGKAGAPAPRPCIELEAAIASVRDRLTCPSERRTERTREAITGLVSRGVISCSEGWLWLV
jgi:putative DNA primase/helicase